MNKLLAEDGQLCSVQSGEEALAVAPQFDPQIVLLDINLPGMDGNETCQRLRDELDTERARFHVIVVSANSTPHEVRAAFDAGADDYVFKPFDGPELRSRVQLHLALLDDSGAPANQELTKSYTQLERLSQLRTAELMAAQEVTVLALAKLVEARDRATGNHLARIRAYSQSLATQLKRNSPYASQIDREFLQDLNRSSPLHDIGKLAISEEILLKPGKLTPKEFEAMKVHTLIGAHVLEEAAGKSAGGGFLKMAAQVARHHHERYDGLGYPLGLSGEQIPLAARIVALADVYDAMTTDRPYKPAWPPFRARHMIEQASGRTFDPVIVAAFGECFAEFLRIGRRLGKSQGRRAAEAGKAPSFGFDVKCPSPGAPEWIYSGLADQPAYAELVQAYVAEMPTRVGEMQETFRTGDRVGLRRLAHQLKGSAGSYGFEKLSPCAGKLERALRDDLPEEEVHQRVLELIAMCQRIRAGRPDTSVPVRTV